MYGSTNKRSVRRKGGLIVFNRYAVPDDVGWLGWFVDSHGNVTAFVGLDRRVVFVEELG